ncbi:hypothetical protein CBL_06635 [Carabus blaptoides fortunei]
MNGVFSVCLWLPISYATVPSLAYSVLSSNSVTATTPTTHLCPTAECAIGGGVAPSVLRLQYSNWRRVERTSDLGKKQTTKSLLDDHVRYSTIVNDVTLSAFNGYNNWTSHCYR